ncbi:MAG TPA: phosphoribosylglycinamide formyltransferase [bacterium]|nr:phosphoribosylglycinamide formyltransferase [bacterium]
MEGIRIGVLASGNGTNLEAIMDACNRGEIPGRVVVVVSNNPKARALDRARLAGIPAVAMHHRAFPDRDTFDAKLVEILHSYEVDLICLAGFLRVLGPSFIRQFPERVMNIHPALLPAFGGLGMYGDRVHQTVLDSGVRFSGCTIHFANEAPDGGPIILQAVVPVYDTDTAQTLAERVVAEEHRLYPEAVKLFAEGRLQVVGRRVRILPAREVAAASTE